MVTSKMIKEAQKLNLPLKEYLKLLDKEVKREHKKRQEGHKEETEENQS